MPAKRTLAGTQRPVTGKQSAGARKNITATASNKTLRARAGRSHNTSIVRHTPFSRTTRSSKTVQAQAIPSSSIPTVEPHLPKPVQSASTASDNLTESPQHTPRKRRSESPAERLVKRQRKNSPLVEPVPSATTLNWENLEKLNSETAAETSGMGERKRTLSRRSSNADTNQDGASVTSQKSSLSLSDYRLVTLERARIVVRHRDIPEHVQSRVDAVIHPEISEDRKSILFSIADDLCDAFPDILEVASREDDCVEPISRALEIMNSKLFGKVFAFRRKADWEPILKPNAQRKSYRSDPADKPLSDTGDSVDRPTKRQQAEASYVSPERSENNMPPPPLPSKQDIGNVKTPRPDITTGFLHSVLTEKLRMLGVDELDADEMLKDLQFDLELYSSPTQPALLVRFPSIVLEGKSYGTGKSMYEAENQAAVSGSCMLVIQHQLAELTERRSPGFRQSKEPLAFSICHEGPIIHLWFHYTTKLGDARFHNSCLLAQCHATLRPTVRTFFIALAGVMEWASTELLDNIAAQLVLVWKAAQHQVT